MKKRLIFLLFLSLTLIFCGCSSDKNDLITTAEIDPPGIPESLVQNSGIMSGASLGKVSIQSLDSEEEAFVQSSFNLCYTFTNVCDRSTSYLKDKINEIIKIEETTLNYTLQSDYKCAPTQEDPYKIEVVPTEYDLIYSTNLDYKYAQNYDVKYTLQDANGVVDSIVYKNLEGTKIYYLEKLYVMTEYPNDPFVLEYIYDATGPEKIGVYVIHQEFPDYYNPTQTYPYTFYLSIHESTSKRKVKLVMLDFNPSNYHIVSFSALEDISSGKTTGALFLNMPSDSPTYEWQLNPADILQKMQNYMLEDPKFLGVFNPDGTSDLEDLTGFDSIWESSYPTKEEVLELYENCQVNYGMVYELELDRENLVASRKDLVDFQNDGAF